MPSSSAAETSAADPQVTSLADVSRELLPPAVRDWPASRLALLPADMPDQPLSRELCDALVPLLG